MQYVNSSSTSGKKAILRVEQLADVDPSGRKDGSLLIFDEASNTWKISQNLDSVLDGNLNTLRIRRGISPSSLSVGEVLFDEDSHTLYYGSQNGILAIAGSGKFVTIDTEQTISGNKTFTGNVIINNPVEDRNPATKLYVDSAMRGEISLSILKDVDSSGLINNSMLVYNAQTSRWKVDQTTLNLTDGGNF